MNPSVGNLNALLNLWVCPVPRVKSGKWKKLDRSSFCSALYRKMNALRYLKVFGPSSGGRILFLRRLTNYREIWANWKRVAGIDFEHLEVEKIQVSPPVRGPIRPVRRSLREKLFWELARRCQGGSLTGPNSPHMAFGVTRKEMAGGCRWTVCFGVYWNLYPSYVTPPSTLWSSLMIWPPEGFSDRDRARLGQIDFFSRISQSVKLQKFAGLWHEHHGPFADFWRHKLQWSEIVPLSKAFQKWSLKRALAEVPVRRSPN
jgi:hypothetical protein